MQYCTIIAQSFLQARRRGGCSIACCLTVLKAAWSFGGEFSENVSTDFGGVEGKIEMQAVEAAASKMEVQDVDEKSDSDNESKGYSKIALFGDSDFFLNQLKDCLHLSRLQISAKLFIFHLNI